MTAIAVEPSDRPVARVARKALASIERLLAAICAVLLALLLCLVLGSVALRYGFGTGVLGADDLAVWLHIALIGLGAPLALGGSLGLRFEALVNRLSGHARATADTIAQALVLLGGIILANGGGEAIAMLGGRSPALGLPEWLRFAAPCLGGVLIVAMTALRDIAEGRGARFALALGLAACTYFGASQLGPFEVMPASLAATIFMLIGLAVGAPLPYTLLAAVYLATPFGAPLTEAAIVSTTISGISKFLLLAIPFFLLAGALFAISGLVEPLVRLAKALVGHWRGGVAQTALLTSILFSGASGSSIANAAFGAKTFAPALTREGYAPPNAGAVIAATSVLDNVIPPSIAFLILAAATELSVGKLLVGGLWAGLLMAAALAVSIRWTAPSNTENNQPLGADTPTPNPSPQGGGELGVEVSVAPSPLRGGVRGGGTDRRPAIAENGSERLAALKASIPAVGLGVIVLAGIRFGVVTPTEAAAVAALYTLLACITGQPSCRAIFDAFHESAVATAGIGLLIGSAAPLAFLLAVDDIGGQIAALSTMFSHSPLAVLLFANLALLVAGMLLDIGAAIVLLAPILLPLAISAGIDPVHFGVILVVNLMIGGLTPPVGILVYIVAGAMKLPSAPVFAAVLPHVAALLCALALISGAAWLAIPS